MRRGVCLGSLFLALASGPVLAQEGHMGAVVGDHAAEAASTAEQSRALVTGDETFQGSFSCLKPVGAAANGPIVCRSQINPVLPTFHFTLSWHLDRDMGDRLIETISIRKEGRAEPFQFIEDVASRASPYIDNNGFESIDMDFDGYLDIRLIADTTAGANVPYRNWLWSADEGRFVENPALDAIVSPEFDPETQEIVSRWRSSAAEGGVDVYVWDNETPVMIHREVDIYDGPSRCARTFFDRIDDEMRETGSGSCS